MQRKIQVIETEHVSTPAVFGFFRPRLLLPTPVWRSLDERELRLVFLHELTHVQQGDILLNWLLILLQAVHWFNPLVWLALKRLRAERELVRDGQVLSRLDSEERLCYGNTLIKLAEQFSPVRLSPSLAPVLNHQTEIKRRIIMITQFKPTPRLVTIASAALAVALGCFTFTRAAEKEPPPQSKEAAGPAPESEKEMQKRGIKVLKQEWAKQNALVLQQQKEVDGLRERLNISPFDEALYNDSGDFDRETLRKYESMRVEALANYNQLNTLYTHLHTLSRSDFRKAVQTAMPDQQLNSRMDHLAESELRLEGLESEYAKTHPDVIKMLRLVKKINEQIEDRLDGILEGLKAKAAAAKAHLDALQEIVDATKRTPTDFATSVRWRSYFTAKRDLENLKFIREKIALRVVQEEIDMAIEKSK